MANPPNIENMQPINGAAGGGAGTGAGGATTGAGADQMATYEQSRKHLKQMLNRQADLKRQLVSPSPPCCYSLSLSPVPPSLTRGLSGLRRTNSSNTWV